MSNNLTRNDECIQRELSVAFGEALCRAFQKKQNEIRHEWDHHPLMIRHAALVKGLVEIVDLDRRDKYVPAPCWSFEKWQPIRHLLDQLPTEWKKTLDRAYDSKTLRAHLKDIAPLMHKVHGICISLDGQKVRISRQGDH